MANTNPETLQDLQDEINTLVANDADTPEEGDDEWETRLNLIWTVIRTWGTTKDVLWEQLWTTFSSGVATITTATTSLSTLLDFRFTAKNARLRVTTAAGGTQEILLIKPSQAAIYSGQRAAYINGNQKAGFNLRLTFTPAPGDGIYGGTFEFDYYKFPFKPEAAADKVEMSDPNYIVWKVASIKALLESQNNKYSVYDGEATDCMDNMLIMNDLGDDMVENTDSLNGAVLGE